jgi:CRP-like cAMP-binding protein
VALVSSDTLEPGMVLKSTLKTRGEFQLCSGTILTEELIRKVRNFAVNKVDIFTEPAMRELGLRAIARGPASLPRRVFPKGEFLFLQGDPAQEIFLLLEGQLEVLYIFEEQISKVENVSERKSIIRSQGRKVTTLQRKNSVFGEMGPLLKQPRTASMKALEHSVVAVIPAGGEGLYNTILENPNLGLSMALGLATRMEDTIQNIQKYNGIVQQLEPIVEEFPVLFTNIAEKLKERVIATRSENLEQLHEQIKQSTLYLRTARFQKQSAVLKDIMPPESITRHSCDERVFFSGKLKSVHRGEIISAPGSKADRIYVLYSGAIGIFLGKNKLIEYRRVGDALGTVRALLGFSDPNGKFEDRNMTLKATGPTKYLEIDASKLGQLTRTNPALILHLSRGLAERLAYTNDELLNSLSNIETYIRRLTRSKDSILDEIETSLAHCLRKAETAQLCVPEIRALNKMRGTLEKVEDNFDRMMRSSRSGNL